MFEVMCGERGCVVSPDLAQAFLRSATEAFAFLRDSGATATESQDDDVFFSAEVQYAAAGWTVCVEYDNRDFLINTVLEIADGSLLSSRRNAIARRQREGYSLWEWIEALGGDAAGASHAGGADTPDRVAAGVREMADSLRTYLPAILRDAATLTPRVQALRGERMRRWREQDRLDRDRHIAIEAADAFRRKDFQRVVELLEPLEPRLTDVDRKKLGYARSRIASAQGQ